MKYFPDLQHPIYSLFQNCTQFNHILLWFDFIRSYFREIMHPTDSFLISKLEQYFQKPKLFSTEIPQHHISLCRGPSWKYKIKNKVDYKTDPDDDDNFGMMMLTMIWILAMTTSNSMLIVPSSTTWLLFGYLCWLPLITQILSGSLLNRKTGYSNAMH